MILKRYPSAVLACGVALLWSASLTSVEAQSASGSAVASSSSGRKAAVSFARTVVEAIMNESGTPGVSVAVGIDGEIVWSDGFGSADLEHRTPVWEETKFRVGSVSKPLTAAALGLLVEQGKLDLDAPVQTYVPSFPEKRWPITTRELAGHLAGVRHYRGQEFLNNRQYASVAEGLEIFADDTLLFEPGARFSYSSYGWNLISAVVEGASGQDFLSYMRENVFERLGLRHTIADYTDSIVPQRTSFYQRGEDGRVLNAPFVDNSYKWAGGGFLSTPEDLVRFGMAMMSGELLDPQTVDLLWTSQRRNDGEETGYGIGWGVRREDGRVMEASHGGGSVGGITFLLVQPQDRAAVAIVGNMSQAPTSYMPAKLILEAFLDPEALTGEAVAGPALSGAFDCSARFRDEEIGSGVFEIHGSPGDYWGRVKWSNETTDRVIFSTTHSDHVRLLTVDERGSLTDTRLRVREDELTGNWSSGGRRGELRCSRG